MAEFFLVHHEVYPEDPYICESAIICINDKHRVTYVRKKLQTGALFWDVLTTAVKCNGDKKYLKAYSQDSQFLREDIMNFLNSRSWLKDQKVDPLPF